MGWLEGGCMMFTLQFWKATMERMLRTVAQAMLGLFVADVTVLNIDWLGAGAVVGTAALTSVLMSIVASGDGNPGIGSIEKVNHSEPSLDMAEFMGEGEYGIEDPVIDELDIEDETPVS